MSCKVGEMLPAVAAAAPLDDENLLPEILLRLPPLPSTPPRSSLVCKRWRCIVSDTCFLRRFRLHHRRSPPLLGFLVNNPRGISYIPTMEAPDHVPDGRFSLQLHDSYGLWILSCRHGLVFISLASQKQVLVWDPVTGDQHRIAIPPGFDRIANRIHGAVLCAAREVHHFQVVLVEAANDGEQHMRLLACVYSSETGVWGNLISTSIRGTFSHTMFMGIPAVLVGNSLYWLLDTNYLDVILEFDLEKQSLAVIQVPMDISEENDFTVMRADDGGLGLLSVSGFTAQLWKRKTDRDGVASWGVGRTIEVDKLLSLNSEKARTHLFIIGFAEENNVVFLPAVDGVLMVRLESLQFRKLNVSNNKLCLHPFESVYTAGNSMSLHYGYNKTRLFFMIGQWNAIRILLC